MVTTGSVEGQSILEETELQEKNGSKNVQSTFHWDSKKIDNTEHNQ